MKLYIFACLILTIFYISLCSSNPFRIKRTAYLNAGDKKGLTFDDTNPEFIKGMKDMVPNFDANYGTRYTKRSNLRRRSIDYSKESSSNESYYPLEFYPIKNVGSLYVGGKNVNITEPMENYGVDSYGYPPYGYANSYKDSSEEKVTTPNA